jgi:hypothetical protein
VSDRALDIYAAIGSDRYLAHSEAGLDSHPLGRRVWEVYDRHFGRFTGATLDPELRRLRHAGQRLSLPRLSRGASVVVVGRHRLDPGETAAIERQRDQLLLVALPSSVQSLRAVGLKPDWVCVDGADARATDDLSLDPGTTLLLARSAEAPRGVDADAIRVAPMLPSWGAPLATAAALALMAGAGTVALAGLPSVAASAASLAKDDEALWALLDLLAAHVPSRLALASGRTPLVTASSSVWRRGWPETPVASAPPRVEWVDHGAGDQLADQARADLARLAPVLGAARPALDAALEARATETTSRPLMRAVETLLAWGADPVIRTSVQDGLGLSFLPRLWRSGISMDPAIRPWRPLVLALHELLEQAERLDQALQEQDGTRPSPGSTRRTDGGRPSGAGRITAILTVLAHRSPGEGGLRDASHGLRDALRSLVSQTHRDVEVLIVHDPASAVPVADALRGVEVRVRCIDVPDGSMADALNAAVAAATGEFIAHHDLDGVSHPERLARQAAYLTRHPQIDVVATTTIDLDLAPSAPGRICDGRAYTPDALARLLPEACPFVHGSVMIRRDVLLRAGGYRSNDARASTIDHELWLRLLPGSRFAKLPTQLYARRRSLARTAAPAGASDGHPPAGAERTVADPQAGRGLPALELGEPHEA